MIAPTNPTDHPLICDHSIDTLTNLNAVLALLRQLQGADTELQCDGLEGLYAVLGAIQQALRHPISQQAASKTIRAGKPA